MYLLLNNLNQDLSLNGFVIVTFFLAPIAVKIPFFLEWIVTESGK
jgi:hypothetical protein